MPQYRDGEPVCGGGSDLVDLDIFSGDFLFNPDAPLMILSGRS